MCELLLLYYLQKGIGETLERKGRDSVLIRVAFVLSWILCYPVGAVLGVIIGGNEPGLAMFGAIVMCLFMVSVGFFVLAAALPEPPRERGYMDYYREYKDTGRVTKHLERDDEEDDDRPRRRRVRRRDDDEEDRPRRSRRDDDDDRPRRRDDGVRREDPDDPPRRKRKPRADEDY